MRAYQRRVSGSLYLTPTVPFDLVAHRLIRRAQNLARGLVAEPVRQLGRPHNVGEQDGYGAFRQLLYQVELPCPTEALAASCG